MLPLPHIIKVPSQTPIFKCRKILAHYVDWGKNMTECLLIFITSTNAVAQKDEFPIRNKKLHPIKKTSEPTQTTLLHAINQKN